LSSDQLELEPSIILLSDAFSNLDVHFCAATSWGPWIILTQCQISKNLEGKQYHIIDILLSRSKIQCFDYWT